MSTPQGLIGQTSSLRIIRAESLRPIGSYWTQALRVLGNCFRVSASNDNVYLLPGYLVLALPLRIPLYYFVPGVIVRTFQHLNTALKSLLLILAAPVISASYLCDLMNSCRAPVLIQSTTSPGDLGSQSHHLVLSFLNLTFSFLSFTICSAFRLEMCKMQSDNMGLKSICIRLDLTEVINQLRI